MHVLVAGAGWLGMAIARALSSRGDRVTAVRRDPGQAALLRSAGAEPLFLDLASPQAARLLPTDMAVVVACQAASGDGVEPYRLAYLDANRTLLEAARRANARAFVYTGSTGVFGQRDGSEVDESTAPAPAGAGAEVLAEAEALVLGGGVPSMVLRLSGLYGPGRLWPVERVRAGKLALGPGDDAWMNFCHLDDAVAAVLSAVDRGRPGAVYHATDAGPARRRDVVEWVSSRLGIPVPRAPEGSRAPEGPNRRIRGERTRALLGLGLVHPSFREGLSSALP
ncbi:MAG TPA: NAD-dependent epimerase/dehydratase family protein [Anaeromyxobacteraceae bacterium]|nr:NAD-dependent epimerase/dehydratase family protein [Anaeromyxobacteraceae bacterium]